MDIVIIALVGRGMGRIAMRKGLSRWWGGLAGLGFLGEVAAAFAASSAGLETTGVYVVGYLGLAVTLLLGAGLVAVLRPASGWQQGMRWAGWCRKCKANVWLTEDLKRCEYGHRAGNVRKTWVPPQHIGEGPAATPV